MCCLGCLPVMAGSLLHAAVQLPLQLGLEVFADILIVPVRLPEVLAVLLSCCLGGACMTEPGMLAGVLWPSLAAAAAAWS